MTFEKRRLILLAIAIGKILGYIAITAFWIGLACYLLGCK